jgi:Spy/CpxP family protein refolding chaperone
VKTWVLVLVGALLVAAVPTAAILLTHDDTSSTRDDHAQHARPFGPGHGMGRGHGTGRGHAFGPMGGGPGGQHLRQQLRRQLRQWQQLTPEQRAKKLAALARRRATALDTWAKCLNSAKDPRSCPAPRGLGPGASALSPLRPRG